MSAIGNTGVKFAEMVRATLGESSTSASVLCRSDKINWQARNKPTIYPKDFDLTDAERIGHPKQTNNGIYFGIRMGTVYGRLADIHNATFEYLKPQGGAEEPWRIGDFRGYNQAARITPTASELTKVINYRAEQAFACRIVHNTNNNGGINLDEILTFMRQSGMDTFSLANAYPCLMLTRTGGTTHAVRALKCWDTKSPTPLYYNGSWHERYYIDMSEGSLGEAAQILPTSNGSWSVKASVFLAGVLSGTGFDLRQWCLTNDGNPSWVLPQAIGLYDACGKAATYKVYDDSPSGGNESTWRVYVASVTTISTGVRVTVNSNLNNPSTTYRIWVNVAGCGSNYKTFTMPQHSTLNVDFTYNDLHMGPPNPAAGSTFTLMMQMHSMSGTTATNLIWEGTKTLTVV